jgi:hypothetical protein
VRCSRGDAHAEGGCFWLGRSAVDAEAIRSCGQGQISCAVAAAACTNKRRKEVEKKFQRTGVCGTAARPHQSHDRRTRRSGISGYQPIRFCAVHPSQE